MAAMNGSAMNESGAGQFTLHLALSRLRFFCATHCVYAELHVIACQSGDDSEYYSLDSPAVQEARLVAMRYVRLPSLGTPKGTGVNAETQTVTSSMKKRRRKKRKRAELSGEQSAAALPSEEESKIETAVAVATEPTAANIQALLAQRFSEAGDKKSKKKLKKELIKVRQVVQGKGTREDCFDIYGPSVSIHF